MNFETLLSVSKVKEQLEKLPIDVNKDICIVECKDGNIIVISISLAADATLLQDVNYKQIVFTKQQLINKESTINISGNSSLFQ